MYGTIAKNSCRLSKKKIWIIMLCIPSGIMALSLQHFIFSIQQFIMTILCARIMTDGCKGKSDGSEMPHNCEDIFVKLGFYGTDDGCLDEELVMNHIACCLGALMHLQKRRNRTNDNKTKMFFDFLSSATRSSESGCYTGLDIICCNQTKDSPSLDGDDMVLRLYWEIFSNVSEIKGIADQAYELVTLWRRKCSAAHLGRKQPKMSLVHAAAESSQPIALTILQLLNRYFPNVARLKDSYGRLPIHYATRGDSIVPGVVKMLADLDPSTLKEIDNIEYETPMHLLVERLHTNVDGLPLLQHLLQYEEARDVLLLEDRCSRTPLRRALLQPECTFAIVKMLADANPASVTMVGKKFPQTAFQQACMAKWNDPAGADEATRYLLLMDPAAATVSHPTYGYPLHLAARRRSLEVLQLLHEMCPQSISADSNNVVDTPLYQAALSGDVKKVRYIYEACPDAIKTTTRYSGKLPLHAVFDSSKFDGNDVDMLGFEVDRSAKSAIAMARAQVDNEAVSFLFTAYPEAAAFGDKEGRFPLHGAARYSSLELLQRIYDAHPAAIRECIGTEYKYPWIGLPLHQAAESGDITKIEFLYSKYPEAISVELPAIRGTLPFQSALYSLPSSREDVRHMKDAFRMVYDLHPPAARATVGRDEKSSLRLVLNFLHLGLQARRLQLRDYEVDLLVWKMHFVLQLWPEAALETWVRDDVWSIADDDSDDERRSIYDFSVNNIRDCPIIPRLMLLANRDHDPAALRDMNYRDRRGAMFLFFAKDVVANGSEKERQCFQDGGSELSPLRIVNMLRTQGSKDLMRKVVMLL